MSSNPSSFQLEKSVPGTFLMQGALGGVLGGFVAALIAAIAWSEDDLTLTLDLTSIAISTGAIIGVIKATFMWMFVRLTGIQYRTLTRVAATGILASLFIAIIGWQFDFDESFLPGCLIWLLSVGIPVALLVGSRVKPWEIFTFGSIAADAGQRSGSRSILATLATLPLRFMSIAVLALLLLYASPAFTKSRNTDEVLLVIFTLSIVVLYPLFSAYLTFRSPRKTVLFLLGVVFNFPVILLCVLSFRDYINHPPRPRPDVLIIATISGLFVVAWVIFLVARLSVRTRPAAVRIVRQTPVKRVSSPGHQCLGSRFAEWQQREVYQGEETCESPSLEQTVLPAHT